MAQRYPCPKCANPLAAKAIQCGSCRRLVLYGLVAAPVSDPSVVERAAKVLAAVRGGPSLAEARRRVASGLPLIVGLSRHDVEQVQERLVDLGLVPRLGPAPDGTPPLSREPFPATIVTAAACALAGIGALLFWHGAPGPTPSPSAAPISSVSPPRTAPHPATTLATPPEIPADRLLQLWVRLEGPRERPLVRGSATVTTTDEGEPAGSLLVRVSSPNGDVLFEGGVSPWQARAEATSVGGKLLRTVSLPFGVALDRAPPAADAEVLVQCTWSRWSSPELSVPLPKGR